jgi:hypothetical protein
MDKKLLSIKSKTLITINRRIIIISWYWLNKYLVQDMFVRQVKAYICKDKTLCKRSNLN